MFSNTDLELFLSREWKQFAQQLYTSNLLAQRDDVRSLISGRLTSPYYANKTSWGKLWKYWLTHQMNIVDWQETNMNTWKFLNSTKIEVADFGIEMLI